MRIATIQLGLKFSRFQFSAMIVLQVDPMIFREVSDEISLEQREDL